MRLYICNTKCRFRPINIDLKPGSRLRSLADGETDKASSEAQSLALYAPVGTTYNLTVDVGHTFYVGEFRTWVHNVGPCDRREEILDNVVLGKQRTGSANKPPDGQHGFNNFINNYAGDAAKFDIPTKGPGGKVIRSAALRQIEGSNNGVPGVFEWIIDEGKVTHRRFIPGGQITAPPNQIPKK